MTREMGLKPTVAQRLGLHLPLSPKFIFSLDWT